MAVKKTSLRQLVKDLEKGKLVSADQVRKTLQQLEINTLRLTADELEKLIKVIEVKKAGEFAATRKAGASLETLIAEGQGLDDGGIELANTTYSQLAAIGKEIGKGQEQGYQLGHTGLGNLAQALGFILKHYKVNGLRHLTQEEIRVVDSAILGAQVIEKLPDKNLDELRRVDKKDADTLFEALAFIPEGLETDLIATSRFVSNVGAAKITYVFEDRTQNQAKGNLSKILSTKVRSFLRDLNKASDDAIGQRLEKILTKVTDPFHISSSPTFMEIVDDTLDSALTGKKSKNKRFKTSKVQLHRRVPTNRSEAKKLREIVKRRTEKLAALALARKKKKAFIIPTVTLKAIINESLALYIKNRMGESKDHPVKLRYQTGRFADSAKLLTLNRTETGAFIGSYSFMRDPYGTFLPGGRLHTQQRDPKLYIEGAIRDIAVQVLKRRFSGIALELA